MTDELNMNSYKITALGNPTSDSDTVTKHYVDTIDNKLSPLRDEYYVHVGTFTNLRKIFRKIDETADNLFGKSPNISTKLSDIKTTIDTIEKTQDNMVSDFPAIATRLDNIKIPHKQYINTVNSKQHGSFTCTPQNNTIKVTANVRGKYRLTLISPFQSNVSTSTSTGVNSVSVIQENEGTEIFTKNP